MRPHDMAKFGYLYLNRGEWAGQQVVPADWIATSTHKHIDGTLQDGYGYQWWVAQDVYMALGYAGQYIVVDPGQNLVVVITSDGNISNDCPGTLPGLGISVRSWRER